MDSHDSTRVGSPAADQDWDKKIEVAAEAFYIAGAGHVFDSVVEIVEILRNALLPDSRPAADQPKCVLCGHVKDDHWFLTDHDECDACFKEGKDEPCTEFVVAPLNPEANPSVAVGSEDSDSVNENHPSATESLGIAKTANVEEITDAKIQEVLEYCAKATEGPWICHEHMTWADWRDDTKGKVPSGGIEGPDYIPDPECSSWKLPDAQFVVFARTDLPAFATALLEARKESQRLCDLVRFARHQLHDEGLITDAEFAAIVSGNEGAVARLETYDALRARVAELEGENDVLRNDNSALGRSGLRP